MNNKGRRRKKQRNQKIRSIMLALGLFACTVFLIVEGKKFLELGTAVTESEAGDRGDSDDSERLQNVIETEWQTKKAVETENSAETDDAVEARSLASISMFSSHGLLMRLSDEKILFDKAGEERMYPASLTKIMTALVAIEQLSDLQQKIPLPDEMFQELYAQNASMAGFLPGDEVAAIDLIYGVMLPSGAECCIGLADYIAGSEQGFVEQMNQKAAELGMDQTHFMNSSGLHDENHYTTAKDMAVLFAYALKNETFRQVATAEYHSTQGTKLNPDGITFYASIFKNMNEDQRARAQGVIEGGKTGYTTEAELCLASLGIIGGQEYVLITMGAEGSHETVQFNIEDALNVYNALGGQ